MLDGCRSDTGSLGGGLRGCPTRAPTLAPTPPHAFPADQGRPRAGPGPAMTGHGRPTSAHTPHPSPPPQAPGARFARRAQRARFARRPRDTQTRRKSQNLQEGAVGKPRNPPGDHWKNTEIPQGTIPKTQKSRRGPFEKHRNPAGEQRKNRKSGFPDGACHEK